MRLVLADGGDTVWEGPDEHVVCSVLEFVCAAVTRAVDSDGVKLEFIDASDSPLLAFAPPGVDKDGNLVLARGYRADGTWFLAAVGAGISVDELDRWGPNNTNAKEVSATMKEQMAAEDFHRAIIRQIDTFKRTVAAVDTLRQRGVKGDSDFITYHKASKKISEALSTPTTVH